MKLYAQVSSERASKGQGGNKFLSVMLTVQQDSEEIVEMGELLLQCIDEDGQRVYVLNYAAGPHFIYSEEIDRVEVKTKGKKQ